MHKEEVSHKEGYETLEKVAQRCGRCFTPVNFQGQFGWRSKQADLFEDVPARGRELD